MLPIHIPLLYLTPPSSNYQMVIHPTIIHAWSVNGITYTCMYIVYVNSISVHLMLPVAFYLRL